MSLSSVVVKMLRDFQRSVCRRLAWPSNSTCPRTCPPLTVIVYLLCAALLADIVRPASGVLHHPAWGSCPDGPPVQWHTQLDAASKALLSPIVFNGKLISLSEDYGGRIAATFRVLKQIKNIGSTPGTVPVNLLPGAQVTLYFVSDANRAARAVSPYCAVHLNATQFDGLRPEGKYIVFAASPLTALVALHRMQAAASKHERALDGARTHASASSPSSSPSSLHLLARDHSGVPSAAGHEQSDHHAHLELYTNYLSAFAAPELLNKRTSRALRRVLCPRCGKPTLLITLLIINTNCALRFSQLALTLTLHNAA